MITPRSEGIGRIVRVLTYGKEPAVIDRAVIDAVESGHRVLVKVASASETPVAASAATSAVASWAEELSQQHGLAWERVGGDVLFYRSLFRAEVPRPPILGE